MAPGLHLAAETQAQILLIVKALAESWNSHDMSTYAAQFTDDADFVNVLGMHWRGWAEIEARHIDIHRTIFRNSTLKILNSNLRPLAASVVLGHIDWEMTGHETLPRTPFSKVRQGIITAVFVERDGRWLIAALQNTELAPVALPDEELS